MTESELEAAKNFRSSYYESLGFRAGEKGAAHLQALISAEAVDVDKLKQFCLKHTLPAYYRPAVWRLVLGVDPPYSDEGVSSFLQEQRLQQFRDLHRALVIMGWICPLEPYSLSPPQAQPLSQPWPALPWQPSPENFVLLYLLEQNRLLSAAVNQMKHDHQVTLCSIAKVFLLLFSREAKEEREREEEEGKKAGKESDEEEEKGGGGWQDKSEVGRGDCEERAGKWIEVEVYWMFSRFVCYWEEQLSHVESLVGELLFPPSTMSLLQILYFLQHSKWLQCLHEVDPTLHNHLSSLKAMSASLYSCVHKWLCHCFAGVLPESCLESIWDKVVAGSCTVLAYVVVAILLSLKRQLLSLTTAEAVAQLLGKLPLDSLGFVGVKAVELWEASGNPTL